MDIPLYKEKEMKIETEVSYPALFFSSSLDGQKTLEEFGFYIISSYLDVTLTP